MRVLTYIFVGAGAAIAIIALAVALLDDGEQATIEPQSDTSQAVTAEQQAAPRNDAQPDAKGDGVIAPPQTVAGSDETPAGVASDRTHPSTAAKNVIAVPTVSIDLAQVRPDGNAVFAGKASPHAEITVFEGDVVLGRTKADENGEWVIIPEAALGAGEHLVSVGAVSEDGTSAVADITMAIQIGDTTEERPLVALLPQTETDIPELLQSPDDKPATPVDVAKSDSTGAETPEQGKPMVPAIAPRSLAWKAGGELVVAGASRGGVRVDANADGNPFGAADTMDDGSWQVAGRVDMTKPGRTMQFILRDARLYFRIRHMIKVMAIQRIHGIHAAALTLHIDAIGVPDIKDWISF